MNLSDIPHESDAVHLVDADKLRALLDVVRTLSASLDLRAVFQTAIEGAVDLMDLDTGAIYLLEDDKLYLGATTPALPDDFPEHLRLAPLADHPRIGEALLTRSFVTMEDSRASVLSAAEREICEVRDLRTVLYVPLLVQRRPLGAFIVGSCGVPRRISEAETSLCAALAYSIALALENARLFESVRSSATELAAAYDAELVRRERLRSLAVALSETEDARSAHLAAQIRERLEAPLATLRAHLAASRDAWRIADDDSAFAEAYGLLAEAERSIGTLTDAMTLPDPAVTGYRAALLTLATRSLPADVDVMVTVDDTLTADGAPIERFLMRATAELLEAISAHTSSTRVEVSLAPRGDDLVLTISDDDEVAAPSVGIPADARSFGIFGLAERAAHLGGRLEVEESAASGTTVRLVVPAKEWVLGSA